MSDNIVQDFYQGKYARVVKACEKTLKKDPKSAFHLSMLGSALLELGAYLRAQKYMELAYRIDPTPESSYNLGRALLKMGKFRDATRYLESYVNVRPSDPDGWTNLGLVFKGLEQFEKAVDAFSRAHQLRPNDFAVVKNYAISLAESHSFADALKFFERLVELNREDIDVLISYAMLLNRLRRVEHAFYWAQHAQSLCPANSKINFILAEIIFHNHLTADPKPYLDRIIADRSDYYFPAITLSGQLAIRVKDWDRGKQLVELALQCGDDFFANNTLWSLGLTIAIRGFEWSWFDRISKHDVPDDPAIYVFDAAHYSDDLDFIRRCVDRSRSHTDLASVFSDETDGNCNASDLGLASKEKLRLGFVSSDFNSHAVSHLFISVFEKLDQSKFELVCFYNSTITDDFTARYTAKADKFIDVARLNDWELYKAIIDHKVDIAFDLNGHTGHSRLSVFESRVAPIQISFLGFPFTTGVETMDYVLLDDVVYNDCNKKLFSESLLSLGRCFMPRDNSHMVTRAVSKVDENLPPDVPILCCFNKADKINKQTLKVWCNVASEVGGVLWLTSLKDEVYERIVAMADEYGLERSRVIRAKFVDSIEDHLSRLTLADVYLDSYPYGGHTSVSDALYCGVPVITKYGRSPVSRVGLSMLSDLELANDLAFDSWEAYEHAAVSMFKGDRRAKTKKLLRQRLLTTHLFDTDSYVESFQSAMLTVAQNKLR